MPIVDTGLRREKQLQTVEAGDNAAPQDTSAASYYCVVHTPSDDTSSRISCSSRLSQVTQCTPTLGHALLTSCQPNGPYGAPQSTLSCN